MAKTKEQKKEVVAKIESTLKNAASSVMVHFRGINVTQETSMRRGFRADGLGYTVAKKTLIRRALENLGLDHKDVPLEGELAIAFNLTPDGDPTLAARRVFNFGKEFGPEKLEILGGIYEGKFIDATAMRVIATIPSMQTLRGMFAQLVNSPRQRFAVVLSKVAEQK
jgi:large subunit ribosomal protein L10